MTRTAKDALQVDGTEKLAAKARRGDKHEKMSLTIEQATVASPRDSRKRAGDYFDFDDGAKGSGAVAASANGVKKTGKKAKTDSEKTEGAPVAKTAKAKAKAPAKRTGVKQTTNTTKPAKKPESNPDTVQQGVKKQRAKKVKNDDGAENGTVELDAKSEIEKSTKKPSARPKAKEEKATSTSATKASDAVVKTSSMDAELKPVPKNDVAVEKKTQKRQTKKKSVAIEDGNADLDGKEGPSSLSKPKPAQKGRSTKQKATKASVIQTPDVMDPTPFEDLVDAAQKEASAIGKVVKKQTAKAKKEIESATKETKRQAKPKLDKVTKSVETLTDSTIAQTKDAPKSRKRKAPDTQPSDSKSTTTTSKRQKQKASSSRKSLGESFGQLVSQGVEAASYGFNTVKDSFSSLLGNSET